VTLLSQTQLIPRPPQVIRGVRLGFAMPPSCSPSNPAALAAFVWLLLSLSLSHSARSFHSFTPSLSLCLSVSLSLCLSVSLTRSYPLYLTAVVWMQQHVFYAAWFYLGVHGAVGLKRFEAEALRVLIVCMCCIAPVPEPLPGTTGQGLAQLRCAIRCSDTPPPSVGWYVNLISLEMTTSIVSRVHRHDMPQTLFV